ncbi:AMP-binding protein [Vibrio vulnificus]|nr:AMP-binding protein [Vibrio vulnificus]
MSVIARVLQHAEGYPEHVAVVEKETSFSYFQLASDVRQVAGKLTGLNVGVDDAVVLQAENSYAFILCYFATQLIGARVVNLASDSGEQHRKFVLDAVNAKLHVNNVSLFTSDINEYTPFVQDKAHLNAYGDLMFTSGTTGEPKGVALTHQQLVLATEHIISQVGNDAEDVELLLMPLSHSFGMGRMRATLYAGGTLVLGYPLQRLKGVFKAMEQFQVTGLGLVPSAWQFITQMSKNLITKYSSQLRYIEFGSAYLSPEDKTLLTEWFPNTRLVMHYGLTEVSRATFTNFHYDNHSAVGCVNRGAQFLILNESGEELPSGEVGEIAFKAPWMLTEYYKNKRLTAESYANGYFRTGDLGKSDGQYLYLTGRLKEIINVGGKKVSPQQVENVLNQDKRVLESACAPLKDSQMGEVVQAFIVLKPDIDVSVESLVEDLKNVLAIQLPVHMRPAHYQIVTSLPKTATGKVQRLKLASI